eukprot:7381659-Prymnesium_polylepis.1
MAVITRMGSETTIAIAMRMEMYCCGMRMINPEHARRRLSSIVSPASGGVIGWGCGDGMEPWRGCSVNVSVRASVLPGGKARRGLLRTEEILWLVTTSEEACGLRVAVHSTSPKVFAIQPERHEKEHLHPNWPDHDENDSERGCPTVIIALADERHITLHVADLGVWAAL